MGERTKKKKQKRGEIDYDSCKNFREKYTMEDLKDMMQYYSAGQAVNVTMQVQDSGGYTEKTITVTLGKKTASQSN